MTTARTNTCPTGERLWLARRLGLTAVFGER
jgi:hypothetical protein